MNAKKYINKFKNASQQTRYASMFVVVFAVIGVLVLTFSHAATGGTMSLTPASGAISIGGTVTVKITEDSSAYSVNAVKAILNYDSTKLQYVSIDASSSAFDVQAVGKNASGVVSIERGAETAVSGPQTVATVTFKAIANGSAAITIDPSSEVLTSVAASGTAANAPIPLATTGATYTISDSTAPSVPAGLTSSTQTATTVSLSWTASTDNVAPTGYKIYRDGTQVGTATTTSYTDNDTKLAAGTSYSYTVAAYDAAGNTSAQSTALKVSTKPDTTAPSTPTNLAMIGHTINSVSLSWTASTDNVGVTGYKIYRNGTQLTTTTGTSYINTGLSPDTSYTYTVAAYDKVGNTSAQTAGVVASSLPDTTAPAAPTGLTTTANSSTSVNLSWTAATDNVGVTGYKIYRNGTQVGTATTTSYTDNNLSAGVSYSYTVAAYDNAKNTSAQSSASAITLAAKLGDIDGDGTIGTSDFSILIANFNKSVPKNQLGDLDGSSSVDITDLSILCSNWGK